MTDYDPLKLNLNRWQRTTRRLFPERQVVLRSGVEGDYKALRFTTHFQLGVSVVAFCFFGWVIFTTAMLFANGAIVAAKERDVEQARSAYKSLLAQVSVYKDKVSSVVKNLEKNHSATMELLEQNNSLDDRLQFILTELETSQEERDRIKQAKAKLDGKLKKLKTDVETAAQRGAEEVEGQSTISALRTEAGDVANKREAAARERERLAKELEYLEKEMVKVASSGTLDIDTIDMELRKVILQRDLAFSERDGLAHRVQELESALSEMELTQLSVFRRLADLARGRIDEIENSLGKTGLDVGQLLEKTREKIGMGGPFIPAESLPTENESLKATLDDLNGHIDQWDTLSELMELLPLSSPMIDARITSSYGHRRDPINGKKALHEGLDFGASYKSKIHATAPGKVVRAGWLGNYGRIVEIDHGMGIRTRYAHLAKIKVKVGDKVDRSTVVGLLGNSGRSTGAHLHYEVRLNNKPLNPIKFIRAGKDVL